jgi:hypothetical protein
MTCHLNTFNILTLGAISANEMRSKRTFTLAIAMLVNMIYALIVKLTNTIQWKIRKQKLRLIFTKFTATVVIKWIKHMVMPLSIKWNAMDVHA